MRLILASGSPRRRELLAMAGFDFEVVPADVDETPEPGMPPEKLVAVLSEKKACAIKDMIIAKGSKVEGSKVENSKIEENTIIIGADTVVAIDGLILGKPENEEDAFDMLTRLQGRMHIVYTGVTVLSAFSSIKDTFVESTKVYMTKLTDKDIRSYIATGEPLDKAGAYGIQERGAVLVERVEGDYFTVVGLPLCRLNAVLKKFRTDVWKISLEF